MMVQVYNWTGFYVGVGGGVSSFRSSGDLVGSTEFGAPFPFPAGQTSTTGFGEVFVGYNWAPSNTWLFGVEALGKFGNANSSVLTSVGSLINAKYTTSFIPSVRLGYLVTPATLLYGRLGWAFTRAQIGFTDNGINQLTDQGAGVGAANRTWISGPQVGVGAEFAVMNNWRLGAEVDYTWYNRASVTGIDPANTTGSRATLSLKPTELSGQVRLSYGF